MDTPIVDKCAERGSDLGLANESWSRIWPTARSLECHARAMAEVIDRHGLLSQQHVLIAWRAFEKENS